MKWISVKDRLPPLNTWVMTYGDDYGHESVGKQGRITIAKLDDSCTYYNILSSGCGCCDGSPHGVTHWMSLPEPPKENE